MKHQNKAFMCLFDCEEVYKKQRLHLLTVSQRECKEVTKNRLLLWTRLFPCDFHFTVPVIAALWLMLFVPFILSQSGEDQHCTAPRPQRLELNQNTHLCLLGLHECIWPYRCVPNNCSLLQELLPCPLKPGEARMKGVALVFISPVNYWYLPLRWLLSRWRWKMSPHIMGTACRHVVWAVAGKREDGSKTEMC